MKGVESNHSKATETVRRIRAKSGRRFHNHNPIAAIMSKFNGGNRNALKRLVMNLVMKERYEKGAGKNSEHHTACPLW
jgi:hypothetical protein